MSSITIHFLVVIETFTCLLLLDDPIAEVVFVAIKTVESVHAEPPHGKAMTIRQVLIVLADRATHDTIRAERGP